MLMCKLCAQFLVNCPFTALFFRKNKCCDQGKQKQIHQGALGRGKLYEIREFGNKGYLGG